MGRKKYTIEKNPNFIIRLIGKDGNFRFEIPKGHDLENYHVEMIKQFLEEKISVPGEMIELFRLNPISRKKEGGRLRDNHSLKEAQIRHGDALGFEYDSSIESKQDEEAAQKRREREEIQKKIDSGDLTALALSKQSKNWTLAEYLKLVEKHTIYIKTQKYAVASNCSLDDQAVQYFQIYLREMAFQVHRVGWIYGSALKGEAPILEDDDESEEKKTDPNIDETLHDFKRVKGGVIYEPDQQGDINGAIELADPYIEVADNLASSFGMSRVGYIFSHNGKRDIPLVGDEIIQAAKRQAKYGEHFVTITAVPNEKGEVNVEAYQVSKLCVKLVEENKLVAHPTDPTKLQTTVPVSLKRKMVTEFDALLMLVNVPISNTKSIFKVGFPVLNRTGSDHKQTHQRLKSILRARSQLPFIEQISDFHLLLYLVNSCILDLKSDIPPIVEAIKIQDNSRVITYKSLIEAYLSH